MPDRLRWLSGGSRATGSLRRYPNRMPDRERFSCSMLVSSIAASPVRDASRMDAFIVWSDNDDPVGLKLKEQ
jgi:hypothetical protein